MTSSTTVHSPLRLYGRSGELAILEGLLARLWQGGGSALVLAAPPGLGRTALLHEAAAAHRPRGPVLHADERGLPAPEALSELAAGRPLLVCADDAHTWGRASRTALISAARGLDAGSRVAVLITADDGPAFAGLPTLRLGPLDEDASAALLDRLAGGGEGAGRGAEGPGRRAVGLTGSGEGSLHGAAGAFSGTEGSLRGAAGAFSGTGGLDPVVRAELLREAAGNPRLLTALTRRLTPDQLAGRTPLPCPLPGAESVLAAHADRLDGLPAHTRALLLLAAAAQEHEPAGAGADALLLLRAGTRTGLPRDFLDGVLFGSAATEGFLQRAGSRVHFSHPLDARAVLHHAPPARRRAAHELLAALLAETGGHPAPLASLVQLSCAASGPDHALASRLEAAATSPYPHAQRSSALARAAALTTDPPLRSARFAAAAEQAALAGDPDLARALLARTGPSTGEPRHGLAAYVHGLLALRTGPAADAHAALVAAAALLGPYDPRRALEALLGAAEAAWVAGDAPGYLEAMGRVDPAPYDRAFASYRAGMCAVLAGRAEAGHALLRQCLEAGHALLRQCLHPAERTAETTALLRAGVAALVLGEVAAACRTGARALAAVRTAGPDALLPQALEHLAYAELRAGLHAGARAHALEGLHAARRTGQANSSVHLHAVLALAASVEGPAEACAAHCDAALAGAGPHGLAQPATLATWARARADLAAGRSEEAAARLGPLVRPGPRQGHFAARMLAVPCYVEAAVLAGRGAEEAGELHTAVVEFAGWTTRTADPQAPAQLARCQALLAPAEEADARYAEALAHHARAGGDFERARTQLLYGQWLRRRRRTREARTPLRDALVAFQRCSARAWAERAAGELRAAGEQGPSVRPTTDGALSALTPQQQRIARCVAEGATNREVALRLSLSPRTVDHHLRNVFAALGIRSRTELARLLGPEGP
ncbi:LuxR C-terminal-related transcriptional regulator [Streptomyces cyaneofuscatus]|uniref:LuxR C-terminal-related transcriptional regulator n=1 Tax=Streptomyces cyaneofuscatus TaxID=66883 RepID=UPI00380511FE